MAIRASVSFDRQERSAGRALRFREFSASISKGHANYCRRRPATWGSSEVGARTEDRPARFVYWFYFAGATARHFLCIAHFPPSERNWSRRKPGRNSKFNAGSDGERAAGVRHTSWRDSRSDQKRRDRMLVPEHDQ